MGMGGTSGTGASLPRRAPATQGKSPRPGGACPRPLPLAQAAHRDGWPHQPAGPPRVGLQPLGRDGAGAARHRGAAMPSFSRPHCHKKGRAPGSLAGRQAACPHCHQAFIVRAPQPVATPATPPAPVSVHVDEPAEGEPAGRGPSVLAWVLWFVVFFASILFCAFCTWVGFKAIFESTERGQDAVAAARGVAVFQRWFLAIVSGYIAARAFDRLTQ